MNWMDHGSNGIHESAIEGNDRVHSRKPTKTNYFHDNSKVLQARSG